MATLRSAGIGTTYPEWSFWKCYTIQDNTLSDSSMNIPNRMTRAEAQAAGLEVDTHCYPWVAYKGPRFNPTELCEVFTDIEAEFVGQMKREERCRLGRQVATFMLKDDVRRIRSALARGESTGEAYRIVRDRFLNVQHAAGLVSYGPVDIEVDASDKNAPLVSACFRKEFGDAGKAKFTAEVRIVVTPDDVSVEAHVFRDESQPPRYYDANTNFRYDRQALLPPSAVALLDFGAEQSRKQIRYVSEKEGLADSASY